MGTEEILQEYSCCGTSGGNTANNRRTSLEINALSAPTGTTTRIVITERCGERGEAFGKKCDGTVKITVILCTFNRCESLVRALESVSLSKLPESIDWEVLVVDNNSRDRTPEVAERFCREYPGRFRYLFEAKPGKSNALNAAIREAHGDVLSFMDDDVIVDPMWLQNLTASLADGRWAGAGGRIIPQWTCTPPPWLPQRDRYALAPLAMFDLGPVGGALDEPPFGTNMAFRKEVFEEYGGFRTDLGPRPGSEIRNEDTEFGQRLLSAGEHLRYEPSAVVYHSIAPSRMRKQYFLAWWFDKARADFGNSVSRLEPSGSSLEFHCILLEGLLCQLCVGWSLSRPP